MALHAIGLDELHDGHALCGVGGVRLPPPGDQEEFYHALLQNARTEPESAVIMLLWRTGMHASTLCEHKWTINWIGEVDWHRPKTGKPLRATVNKSECAIITRCVFAGLLPTAQRTLRRWVARIGERAGIAGCCPLMLRHSRAIYLLDAGIGLNRVAHLLGCSWAVLEKHYAQIEAARLVE